MSAPGAFDHQQVLPEFIGKPLHLEIPWRLLRAKTGQNPYEWGVSLV
jgi:hypothetical protein